MRKSHPENGNYIPVPNRVKKLNYYNYVGFELDNTNEKEV